MSLFDVELEYALKRSLGQTLRCREGAEEATIVGDDGRDLGLLEHYLRDPHRVGGARSSPRETASAEAKPSQQGATNPLVVGRRFSAVGTQLVLLRIGRSKPQGRSIKAKAGRSLKS